MERSAMIEAILFARGEPVSFKELAKIFDIPEAEIKHSVTTLQGDLAGRGVTIVKTETHAEMRTAEGAHEILESLRKEELSGGVGKAALETLAILFYKGPSTRSEVEYIRGVNAGAAIRTLLMRGLVERMPNPKDQRSYLYKPTTEALAHLGVSDAKELPQYQELTQELTALEEALEEKDKEHERD